MTTNRNTYSTGRLHTKPQPLTSGKEVTTGMMALGLDTRKDGLLYVPKGYDPEKPGALAVMLHGSGANPEQGIWLLHQYADAHNLLLLAPASRQYSWDIIASNQLGPDVIYIEQALAQVFDSYAIDSERIAIGGFSDGASYALGLGLTNGDLFTHVIAFSPGFSFAVESHGKPAIFISHGVHDRVLPIANCGRKVSRTLKSSGYSVNYLEFDGEHEIPGNISKSAIEWFMNGNA